MTSVVDNSTANGGFTTGEPFRPVIKSTEYGFRKINVSAQQHDQHSLLNFISQLIKRREQFPELANGEWENVDSGSDQVLIISYRDKGRNIRISHNFSDQSQEVTLADKSVIRLGRYGFKWERLN